MEFFIDCDLRVLNDLNSAPTYVHWDQGDRDTDITFTNSAQLATSRGVVELAENLSDHNLLKFDMQTNAEIQETRSILSWKKANWEDLESGLDEKIKK